MLTHPKVRRWIVLMRTKGKHDKLGVSKTIRLSNGMELKHFRGCQVAALPVLE